MTPQQTLKEMDRYLKSMQEAKSKYVAVGVIGDDAGESYEGGATLTQIAAIHEYGRGKNPQRSFLRMPQELKQEEIKSFINLRFRRAMEGEDVNRSLGLIGAFATNISKGAFQSEGYGSWPALSPITVELRRRGGAKSGSDVGDAAKASRSAFFEPQRAGEMKPLIDTGRLMNSITWEVR